MVSIHFLTLDQIIQNSALITEIINVDSNKIVFRALSYSDVGAVEQFLKCLSEKTRRFATYPSYDLRCAQQFCDEIDHDDKLRMVATTSNEKIIAVFEFNFDLVEFDRARYRKYGIELNCDSVVQLAPCIADEYQNQNLGTKLLQVMINLAKRLGKTQMILWAGVLIDNEQAIRFYEKNKFRIFRDKYIAEDGYECYDGILNLT